MMKKGMITIMVFVFLMGMSASVSPAISQVIELTVSNHNPPPSTISRSWNAWGKLIEEQSKGRLKLTMHHGGALLAEKDAYRGVQTGIADIAHYVLDRREGFHLSTVTTLPFLGLPAQLEAGELWMELLKRNPAMAKEWEGVKIIGIFMMPPTHVHTRNKVVVTPTDIKGLKIHGAEFSLVQTMHAAGASPIQLDITEMFTGLERGLLDGVMNHFNVLHVFKVLDLLPYHTVFGDGGINMTPMFAIMNAKKFASLPSDLQKVLEDGIKLWTQEIARLSLPFGKTAFDYCVDKKHNITHLTPAQVDAWRSLVQKPIHDKWIEDAEARKLPGRALYEDMLSLIKKYQKK